MTDYSPFGWIGAIVALLFIVAILLIPFFIWDMRNSALKTANAIQRIEKILEAQEGYIRNMDVNLAHAAIALHEAKNGQGQNR